MAPRETVAALTVAEYTLHDNIVDIIVIAKVDYFSAAHASAHFSEPAASAENLESRMIAWAIGVPLCWQPESFFSNFSGSTLMRVASPNLGDSEMARQYGAGDSTIRRWRYRDDAYDLTRTRHDLLATLTTEQEEVSKVARTFLRLSLDDLLVVAHEFLNYRLSHFGLHRVFKRREVPKPAELARLDTSGDEKPQHKPFEDYESEYVHIGIKHLKKISDEQQKHYLCMAIDKANRWVCSEDRIAQSIQYARECMKLEERNLHFRIQTVLTSRGIFFTAFFRFFVVSCGFGLIEQAAHRAANQVDHGDEVGLVPVAACA